MNPVYLHGITTQVPPYAYEQAHLRELVKLQYEGKETIQRIIHRLYTSSGIDRRHSCVWQSADGTLDTGFFDVENGRLKTRSTAVRNARYQQESRPMFAGIAIETIRSAGLVASDITHVITVSCTGFYAPGPEFYVVKDAGLRADVQRFHLGFMGCFAAFPAWKLAAQICTANTAAHVLVICLELCTLHLQFKEDTDNLLSGCVFADGAGACIVSGRRPASGDALRLIGQRGHIAPEGEGDMAWTIGDSGFDMVLSAYIPRIIEANVAGIVQETLQSFGFSHISEVKNWAVHPGGRAILDKIQTTLGLDSHQLDAARDVLRGYGNMSSATIFFVLKAIMANRTTSGLTYATAFGPGLTIESALFEIERAV